MSKCSCKWQKVKCHGPVQNANYTRTQRKKWCDNCKSKRKNKKEVKSIKDLGYVMIAKPSKPKFDKEMIDRLFEKKSED